MDRKIIDYILCEEGESIYNNRPRNTIGEMVLEGIKNGYQPFGSPFINRHKDICQAMVKYEEVGVSEYMKLNPKVGDVIIDGVNKKTYRGNCVWGSTLLHENE